jgi:Ca2+-transporting ATPase
MEATHYDFKATRAKLMPDTKSYNRILFTSSRKRSATLSKKDGVDWLYTFGNVIKILESCSKICNNDGKEVPLTEEIKEGLLKDVAIANSRALRTLGVARKRLEVGDHLEGVKDEVHAVEESGLTFYGYLGLRDQLRDRVQEAVEVLTKKAGVIVRMITGDNYDTAVAIARECGILDNVSITSIHKDVAIMAGHEFYDRVGGKALYAGSVKKRNKSCKEIVKL